MPELLLDAKAIPMGGHCLSLHVDDLEAARNAADFLAGTPDDQAGAYWVADAAMEESHRMMAAEISPEHVGCIVVLPHAQAELQGGHLRPTSELREFLAAHPDGVSAAGETLTRYWNTATIPDHLEYEAWFQGQERGPSRFLCPYNVREIPPDFAAAILRELGARHSHIVLSASPEPGVRLLELFVFGTVGEVPEILEPTLGWAVKRGLVWIDDATRTLVLSPDGDEIVREWASRTVVT
jgi:hypothetical protein